LNAFLGRKAAKRAEKAKTESQFIRAEQRRKQAVKNSNKSSDEKNEKDNDVKKNCATTLIYLAMKNINQRF
jgi:hypothetical protein